jgi:hypothetical protein
MNELQPSSSLSLFHLRSLASSTMPNRISTWAEDSPTVLAGSTVRMRSVDRVREAFSLSLSLDDGYHGDITILH